MVSVEWSFQDLAYMNDKNMRILWNGRIMLSYLRCSFDMICYNLINLVSLGSSNHLTLSPTKDIV